jgi:hypothetical protein
MALPPPAFIDPTPSTSNGKPTKLTELGEDESVSCIPDLVVDLPMRIKERLDQMVNNDEELGTQLSAMDALLLGRSSCFFIF